MTPQEPFWLFLHIPKTAGTTLRTIVDAQYGPDAVLTYYNQPNRQLLDNLPYLLRDERRSYRALIGHYPFGVHAGLPRPARYITFVRDPIRRVISDYHERCARLPGEMSNGTGGLLTLDEALERYPSHYDNIQLRYLTGIFDRPLTEDDLAAALANLDEHFEFAGTVERFDEGMAALSPVLGWSGISYERQNVGPRPSALAPGTAERIAALTSLEQALYDRIAVRHVRSRTNRSAANTSDASMASQPQILSLLLPTRGRPAEFARFVRSVAETAAAPERVEILAYVDEDDPKKFAYLADFKMLAAEPAVAQLMNLDLRVEEPLTTPLINNILAERAQGSVLMIANDDQVFRDRGWDARIDQEAARFPDGIFCMWFNDGRYGEKLCTFPILGRRWVEVLGYVEPPFFEHFNCDLWTWQIALMIGRTHYIGDVLVEHLHPDTGKSAADATTERNLKGNRAERDRAMFVKFERYRILDAERLKEAIPARPTSLESARAD